MEGEWSALILSPHYGVTFDHRDRMHQVGRPNASAYREYQCLWDCGSSRNTTLAFNLVDNAHLGSRADRAYAFPRVVTVRPDPLPRPFGGTSWDIVMRSKGVSGPGSF